MATGDGWRLQDIDPISDQERELYERAHEATKEAQRQGDAQLQAAVAAAAVSNVHPVASPIQSSAWTLKFDDKRLEAVYWRKCNNDSDFSDTVPTACESIACLLQLWMMGSAKRTSPDSRQMLIYLGHTCVAACCMMMTMLQVLCSKWYRHNRGVLLWYFVIILWCWESFQLFHAASNGLLRMASHVLVQCIFMSFLYRVPFCLHMRSRSLGFCCQAVATIARDVSQSASFQMLVILVGHFLGSLLAYMLDRQARSVFLQSLPRWLLDDVIQVGSSERGVASQASSKQMWSVFYPEFFEKPEEAAAASNSSERTLAHRALGGFAGGFGGVSGLKCANPSSAAPLSSSSNSLGGHESVSESSGSAGSELPDAWSVRNAGCSDPPEQGQDSPSSASSQARPDSNIRRRF